MPGGFESAVGEVLKGRVQLTLGRSVSVLLNVQLHLIVTGRDESRRQILTRGPVREEDRVAVIFKIIANSVILLLL